MTLLHHEMTDWHTAKVHPDHHIACQYALYSLPSATCPPGQKIEVRLGSKLVRICHRGRRAELDSVVVPSVRGQPGASVSVRFAGYIC